MKSSYIQVDSSGPLSGTIALGGAKNAVLVIMASLILTRGRNTLSNVPFTDDVMYMIALLESLGAVIDQDPDLKALYIDTTDLVSAPIDYTIMKKMRASILVMGPLLARFGYAEVAAPGGCVIGARPIDYHIKMLRAMGVACTISDTSIIAEATQFKAVDHILDYPSVGATENCMMAATCTPGMTRIINAALEPEVFDLIDVLKKMGAQITIEAPTTILIQGVTQLKPITHEVMLDRLEAGTFLLAAALTGGSVTIERVPVRSMKVFLAKLEQMGHTLETVGDGLRLRATQNPVGVSFKTMPYPGFPTDLQAPMMAALSCATGMSAIHETVFENRLVHVRELQKMGAQIIHDGQTAKIVGVDELYGPAVIAPDIRAGAALVLAGLVARGTTTVSGIHHIQRGYDALIPKLASLGAAVEIID